MTSRELTPKQERFVQEYLGDLNATQAAIRAGYSEKTARAQASRLLTKVAIRSAIAELKKEYLESLGVTKEGVLYDFARLKDACLEPDENGKPRDAANAVRCLGYLGNNLGLWQKEKYDDGSVQFIVKGLKESDEDDKADKETPDNVVKLPA